MFEAEGDPHNDTEEEILSYLSSSSREQQKTAHKKHPVIDCSVGKPAGDLTPAQALLAQCRNPESSFDTAEHGGTDSVSAAEQPDQ